MMKEIDSIKNKGIYNLSRSFNSLSTKLSSKCTEQVYIGIDNVLYELMINEFEDKMDEQLKYIKVQTRNQLTNKK